ncbi:hypothetical protein ACFLR2_00485 [Chlamydiota bacterium]
MNKLVASLLTILTTISAYALPVGNPWDASLLSNGVFCAGRDPNCCDPCSSLWEAVSVRIGFYGDYVFDHHTRVHNRNRSGTIHSTKLFTNAGCITLNFLERLDLFSTLGTSELKFETRASVLGGVGANDIVRFETSTHFSWSVGARGTLWQCGCFGIGAEAQYFQTQPRLNFIAGEADNAFYFPNGDHAKYQEWQVGLGASYRVNIGWCSTALVPYAAVKWDRVHVDFNNRVATATFDTYTLFNLRNRPEWGYAIGITLVGCNKASVTVEGRFADENAVHVNTQFRF